MDPVLVAITTLLLLPFVGSFISYLLEKKIQRDGTGSDAKPGHRRPPPIFLPPSRRRIAASCALGSVDSGAVGLGKHLMQRWLKWASYLSMGILGGAGAILVGTVLLVSPYKNDDPEIDRSAYLVSFYALRILAAIIFFYGLRLLFLAWRDTRRAWPEEVVTSRLYHLILWLEYLEPRMSHVGSRARLSRLLEELAKDYAYLCRAHRAADSVTDDLIREWRDQLVLGVRQLKTLVLLDPSVANSQHLSARLRTDLGLALAKQWEHIETSPDMLPPGRPTGRHKALWGGVSALLFAAAIFALFYSTELGEAGPVIVSAVGAFAVVTLRQAGMSMDTMSKATDTFSGLRG